jgi:hypothetical protein
MRIADKATVSLPYPEHQPTVPRTDTSLSFWQRFRQQKMHHIVLEFLNTITALSQFCVWLSKQLVFVRFVPISTFYRSEEEIFDVIPYGTKIRLYMIIFTLCAHYLSFLLILPFVIFFSVLSLAVSPLRQALKRIIIRSYGDEDIKKFLFLRSFQDDNKIGMKVSPVKVLIDPPEPVIQKFNTVIKRRGKWTLEKEMADILDSYGLVLYISSDRGGNIASYHSTDENWRTDVAALMQEANVIICSPGATQGTSWEVGQIFEHGHQDKTIFLCPGNNRTQFNGWRYGAAIDQISDELREWNKIRKHCEEYVFPNFDPMGLFFVIGRKNSNEKFQIRDKQSWGTSIGTDLLAILERAGLMKLTFLTRMRLNIYMYNRPEYFNLEGVLDRERWS